jgi:hypothetical protein
MRIAPLVLVSALVSCATSPGIDQPATTETVRVVSPGRTVAVTMMPSHAATAVEIDGPPAAVFSLLRAVYEEVGIEVNHLDSRSRVLGHNDLRVRRRLGNVPLSRYLDCGRTQGSPSADTYEITLQIQTQVRDNTSNSTVQTTLAATGASVNFPGAPVRCTSTGELEKRIFEVLEKKMKG